MIRLSRAVFALVAAQVAILFIACPAQAQGYAQRWSDGPPRSERGNDDDDSYFRQRLKYYSRDTAARRDAERLRRMPDRQGKPRDGFSIPFLQRLFGGSSDSDEQVERDPGVEIRRAPRTVRRRPPPARFDPAKPAPPPVVAQHPGPPVAPTTFAAVFGDSIADELAAGLEEAFSDAPELAVRRHVKANAGLVRADYFDFVAEAKKAVASEQITYAVIDVGVNDRQPFPDMRQAAPLSEEWSRRYVERVDALLAPFKEKKIPVYWVGLAASESNRATADHTTLNALVKERVEAAGGTYVDVWDGFVDEDGSYMADGPQLDGQTGRLRLDDGVHFSKAGARKLAHYVEREIRKVFTPKPAADAIVGAVEPNGDAGPGLAGAPIPVERPKPISSPVVVLTAPRRAENGELAAAAIAVPARDASPQAERVLVNGEALDAEPGRLDDHRWPGAGQPAPAPQSASAGPQPGPATPSAAPAQPLAGPAQPAAGPAQPAAPSGR